MRTEIIVVNAECRSGDSGTVITPNHGRRRVFCSQRQEGQSMVLPRLQIRYKTKGKIVAIGRNYADHVKELKNPLPKEPFFFLKPTTSYLPSGGIIEIPRGISAHHEGVFPPRLLFSLLTLVFGSRAWSRHWKGGTRYLRRERRRAHSWVWCVNQAISFRRSDVNTSQLSPLT